MNIAEFLYPENPDVLDKFHLDITDQWNDGAGFSADVWLEESQFSVENEGEGEANKYLALDDASIEAFREFQRCAKQAYPTAEEPEDLAVLWLEIKDIKVQQ